MIINANGGAATSANKLNSDAGSAVKPVYFKDGVPVEAAYELNETVPKGAKFTDTTYSTGTASAAGLTKLYAGTGTATDGSMTQAAITNAISTTVSSAIGSAIEASY